jgi:hypothetical protein
MTRDIVYTHKAWKLTPLERATIKAKRVLTECGIRVHSQLISDRPTCPQCIFESTIDADLAAAAARDIALSADGDQGRIESELNAWGNPSRRAS